MTRRAPTQPPQLVCWRGGGDGRRIWSSPEWTALTGQDEEDSEGAGWLGAVHADDRERVRDDWRAATATGSLISDHRIRTEGGDYLHFRSCALPDTVPGDVTTIWSGCSVLIEDFTVAMQQKDTVLNALRHRVRNTLGTVRSVARLSLHGNESAEEYAAALDGRIGTMARVQAELIRNPLARTDLAQLVAGELAAFALREGDRVSIDGPTVHLSGRAAETMGLALHELSMNALRHGALSGQDGTIEVHWHFVGAGEAALLRFAWSESMVNPSSGRGTMRGFGTHVLESILPYQLGAAASLRFEPTGAHVTIDLPISTSILPPG